MPEWTTIVLPLVAAVAMIASAAAVTRSRIRERRAVQAAEEAHFIKNDFVAMVSHELRTPLTSIAGFADSLVNEWRHLPEEEVDEFLGHIHSQALYLGELVEDVLVIPRLEAGRLRFRPVSTDLGKLVHDVAQLVFPPGSGREATVAMPTGVTLEADPKRVKQVLRNLLENAGKYGGAQILVEGFGHGDYYVVVVADNGTGVPDVSINRIFQHFEQLSKGDARSATGIGLGLPIARRLARAMGGDVWYERRFPTGSRFCFSLPVTLGELEDDGTVRPVPESAEPRRPTGVGAGGE